MAGRPTTRQGKPVGVCPVCRLLVTSLAEALLLFFQAEAVKGQRVKITISDIVDRANGASVACMHSL